MHDIDNPAIYNANSLERNVREYKDNEKFEVMMNPPYGGAEGEQIKNNFPADLNAVVKQQTSSLLNYVSFERKW